jgi:hypothetical protein
VARRSKPRSHLPCLSAPVAHVKTRPQTRRDRPGNRAASSLGRIVPTEAKPSELSACILSLAQTGVKAKTVTTQHVHNK